MSILFETVIQNLVHEMSKMSASYGVEVYFLEKLLSVLIQTVTRRVAHQKLDSYNRFTGLTTWRLKPSLLKCLSLKV